MLFAQEHKKKSSNPDIQELAWYNQLALGLQALAQLSPGRHEQCHRAATSASGPRIPDARDGDSVQAGGRIPRRPPPSFPAHTRPARGQQKPEDKERRNGEGARRRGAEGSRCPSNSQRGKRPWSGEARGWDGKGVAWGGGGWQPGRGDALGPAVQLRQPTHSSPLGLRGKPEGVPERKGRAGSAPQGQGRTPTEPSPDTGLTSQLPRAPRPAPVGSEEPSGRAGPGRAESGRGIAREEGGRQDLCSGPAPWSPARREE
ncbi:proline-rich proteoglycan 2-like [Budorcas taxicolor]|uniref:proline-rich proteoglycan 2-like n=1 Tax=Budorcas taxicolor TaxID=37181 RepID=UPI002284965C|nr:proline-rich proteoglycan 2-like [Budorcas taxicolor]